eukprot:TRINITY_DN25609_c0_g1_i1.p1 TRINITY_DN25609_c0_g1~~TRINITY_DN25609_c0_g1_i1.p1  ORF type:complete len:336 (-),score=83.12 TRINITY_DN25609_c0_g1_i1:72-1079(-)
MSRNINNGPRVMTLSDLRSDNGTLDNPYQNEEYGARRSAAGNQMRIQFVAVDGSKAEETVDADGMMKVYCQSMCCPCCIGGPCSPQRKKEWFNLFKTFTFWIIITQLVMFFIGLGIGGFESSEVNPMLGTNSKALVDTGAKYGYAMQQQYHFFRFITPVFLHAGFVHLFFNLYSEFKMCTFLEKRWGAVNYLSIFFVSGVSSILLSVTAKPDTISVGASGAILGVTGAYLADLLFSDDHDKMTKRIGIFQLVLFIIFSLAIGFTKFIDFTGHLGGVFLGFFLGVSLFISKFQSLSVNARKIISIACVIVIIAYFIILFVLFFTTVQTTNLFPSNN